MDEIRKIFTLKIMGIPPDVTARLLNRPVEQISNAYEEFNKYVEGMRGTKIYDHMEEFLQMVADGYSDYYIETNLGLTTGRAYDARGRLFLLSARAVRKLIPEVKPEKADHVANLDREGWSKKPDPLPKMKPLTADTISPDGCKMLVAAIVEQAYKDAKEPRLTHHPSKADWKYMRELASMIIGDGEVYKSWRQK